MSTVPMTQGGRRGWRFSRRFPWGVGVALLVALAGSALLFAQRHDLPREALVTRVLDGDTIELASGQHLRYIGVDTPETRQRRGGEWVAVREPFGKEATAFNRELVEGQRVRIDYDVEPRDKYGRLLGYVYREDVFVNAELLRQGYAQQLTIPPNVRYVELFQQLVQEARQAKRGLWSR